MTAVTGNANRAVSSQGASGAGQAGKPPTSSAPKAPKGLPAEDSVTRDNPERDTQRRAGARNASLDNTQAQRVVEKGEAAQNDESGRLALDLKARAAVRV